MERPRRPGTRELLERLHAEDRRAVDVLAAVLPELERAVELLVDRWRRGGRLIYVGAGTSGRIGALDAVECLPTFGARPERVLAVVAGGVEALHRAVEAAEDDEESGRARIDALEVGEDDLVVGLSASGNTPFTCAALERAAAAGAATVAVTGSRGRLAAAADVAVVFDVGPEVVSGSTRLKAGTAQKLVCNGLTTAAFTRLGRVIDGHMVAVRTTSEKLRRRALRILVELGASDEADAEALLAAAGDDLPTALVMGLAGVSRRTAARRLRASGGDVPAALEPPEEP